MGPWARAFGACVCVLWSGELLMARLAWFKKGLCVVIAKKGCPTGRRAAANGSWSRCETKLARIVDLGLAPEDLVEQIKRSGDGRRGIGPALQSKPGAEIGGRARSRRRIRLVWLLALATPWHAVAGGVRGFVVVLWCVSGIATTRAKCCAGTGGQLPVYGQGHFPADKWDEAGYAAIPPCLWQCAV